MVNCLIGGTVNSDYKPQADTRLLTIMKIDKEITVTYLSGDPWVPGREVTQSTVSIAALARLSGD